MKVSTERLADSQVVLNIEADLEEFQQSMEQAYRRLASRAVIPGFRKGKAPRSLVERYLGRETILEDALDHLVPQLYTRAITEQSVDAIAQPEINVTQVEPVTFKATVPVRPTVELGAYQEIRLSLDPVEVTEEQVTAVLERLRQQLAPWEPAERPVEYEDLVTINADGTFDGEPLAHWQDQDFYVQQDWPIPLPGFGDKLVGLEKGKETELIISYPADYRRTELAGKEGHFKVLITEIKAKKLPEINDDFAKSLGEGYETLTALKEGIESRLKQRGETEARNRLADKAVDELLACSKLEFPSILVDVEVERMIQERKDRLAQSRISFEHYLAEVSKSEDQVRAELRPQAVEQVRQWLALNKLAEVETIEISSEEIDAEAEAIVARSQADTEVLRRALARESSRDTVRRILLTRKTLGRLVSIVTEGTVAYPGEPVLPDVTSTVEAESTGEPTPEETVAETEQVAETP